MTAPLPEAWRLIEPGDLLASGGSTMLPYAADYARSETLRMNLYAGGTGTPHFVEAYHKLSDPMQLVAASSEP